MSRLGKRERELRKQQWAKFREVRAQVVADNLATLPPVTPRVSGVPYGMLAGRSCQIAKDNLFLHSHTKGAYAPGIGQGSGPTKARPKTPGRFEPNYWSKDYGKRLNTKDRAADAPEVWRGGERIA